FAGTFAAMARAIGLPSRVAVGFTPGVLEADGLWHITGRQAHAWPEVFVAGYGWVAFEPTPGRGAPGAEAYTGVPAQQDVAGGGGGPRPPLRRTAHWWPGPRCRRRWLPPGWAGSRARPTSSTPGGRRPRSTSTGSSRASRPTPPRRRSRATASVTSWPSGPS